MAQEYLPAPSNVRLADLMKEHNISQPELAKEIGCSKSTISRFISGAKGTLTHEQVLRIARLFNVSTDFLLGETNIPDRKNYDIAELGLSVDTLNSLAIFSTCSWVRVPFAPLIKRLMVLLEQPSSLASSGWLMLCSFIKSARRTLDGAGRYSCAMWSALLFDLFPHYNTLCRFVQYTVTSPPLLLQPCNQ